MSLLRRRPSASAVSLVVDRCWDDPDLDAVVDVVEDRRTSDPDAAVDAALAHLATVRSDPERLECATDALGERLAGLVEPLRRRASGAGTAARADAADLAALLGHALNAAAWQARGGGRASTVGVDAAQVWTSLNTEADDVLRHAVELVPDHAGATVGRLRTAFGVEPPGDEWWSRFDAARRARSTQYRAFLIMASVLSGKWFGSSETMLDFAREAAAGAPAGDPVTAVLPLAHCEHLVTVSMQSRSPRSIRDVQKTRAADGAALTAASDRWLGRPPVPPHPFAPEAHQWFAWAFRVETDDRHRDLFRHHLQGAGDRLADRPWAFFGDPAEDFLKARRKAGLPG